MVDADVIREVTEHVEEAIRQNRRIETALIVILALLTFTGLGMLGLGAYRQSLALALPGSLCEIAIAMPIRSLVKLRQENIRLAILPQLIRMADNASAKRLVMQLVETLIKQVGS